MSFAVRPTTTLPGSLNVNSTRLMIAVCAYVLLQAIAIQRRMCGWVVTDRTRRISVTHGLASFFIIYIYIPLRIEAVFLVATGYMVPRTLEIFPYSGSTVWTIIISLTSAVYK